MNAQLTIQSEQYTLGMADLHRLADQKHLDRLYRNLNPDLERRNRDAFLKMLKEYPNLLPLNDHAVDQKVRENLENLPVEKLQEAFGKPPPISSHGGLNKWDRDFLALARFWADLKSKDPSTKVGAVLVGIDRRDVALGYNGFPSGILDSPARLNDRAMKLRFTMHAERNALDNAHFDTEGATLYVTLCPCVECAKSVISKGIEKVICPTPTAGQWQRWGEDFCCTEAMFKEVGITLIYADDPTTSFPS